MAEPDYKKIERWAWIIFWVLLALMVIATPIGLLVFGFNSGTRFADG